MQKKMHQQCHCEGAVSDCGNLNPHNTKIVYFLRSEAVRNNSIGEPSVAISLLRKLEIAST